MKAVPRGAVRGLAAFGFAVLLSGCGLQQPVQPVPSESPEPSAGVSTPVTPSSAPATSTDPSPTPSATPTPAPSTSAPLRQLTPPATPTVTGAAVFGTKLGISQGAWKPAPVALAFQWLRDGEPITAATSSTYQLTGDDITHRIAVIVTGSKDGYADSSLRSSQVGPIAPAKLKPPPRPSAGRSRSATR